MSNREIRNAKITSTMLGKEDHGTMTCMINLDYGGSGQGFGGYAFDEWDESKKERVGVAYGMKFIKGLLEAVGVERWEDLPGTVVRVDCDYGKIYRIGHFINDAWFVPSEV